MQSDNMESDDKYMQQNVGVFGPDPPGSGASGKPIVIDRQNKSVVKLQQLEPNTKYVVKISAVTSAGSGQVMSVETATLPDAGK